MASHQEAVNQVPQNLIQDGSNVEATPVEAQFEINDKRSSENSTENEDVTTAAEKEIIDLEEKRRRECFGNMEKIEKEFADLKEKFFNDKIEALRREYEMIKTGTHQGFLKKCKELDELRQHKLWAAERWKEYQFQNLEHMFEAEKMQAEDEFEADRNVLRDRMMTSAVEKRRKLSDEKTSLNITDVNDGGIPHVSLRKHSNLKESKEQPYKRRLHPTTHVAYVLKENEILEDLNVIQKGMSSNSLSFTKYTVSVVAPKPSSISSSTDVYTDRGKLYYHGQVFDKGKDVFIEAKHENGKWQGTIVVCNPAEIHIKSIDGTKSRFSLSQLRNGKYTVTPVN